MAPRKKESTEESITKKYEHYVRPVPVLENFEDIYKLNYHLIKSYDELLDFYKTNFKPNSFFAWDTETTSLNPEQGEKTGDLVEGKIVGYSFTQDGHNGYYVPLAHPDYAIGYKGLKVLYAMICKSKLNLLYNARFDIRFLEFMTPEKYDYIPEPGEKIYNFDLSKIKYLDVQCATWLADTNIPMPSLKKSEKHFLGWVPPTFSETTGNETNFGYLPAEQGYRYACIDALGTYHLFFKTERFFSEAGAAGKLDNDSLYPLMKLENTPIYIDHDYLVSIRKDIIAHLDDLRNYLYNTVGKTYNINSGRELISVFQSQGIDTGKRTSSGLMETNIKAIESYLSSHGDNEYLNKLIEYKKLTKFDNSYLEKLISMSEPDEAKKHPVRFCYFTCRVPTGRLASGTDGKNTFFSPINFQSLPKPHSHNYHVHKATQEQIANNEDLCGYIFNDDPTNSLGLTEGQDPHLNVRKAIKPQTNDSVIVSVDMCLEAGSPVQSKRGYIGISDLIVGDEVLTPNGYTKVIRVKNTGLKQLYKIKTTGQAIYCSEDHPFMINNEQVQANKVKDTLIQNDLQTYIEYDVKKEQIFNKFKYLYNITSIVEKANYIKNNNLIDYFIEAYNNYTTADVAKMCFIKNSSFRHLINYLNLNNICHKNFIRVPYQHVFNPFKTSNPTSAYLLGYILGNGNINIRRNNYCTLNITSKDYAHINQIKNIFDNTIKLLEHNKNGYKAWSLTINDQDVCNDLIKLGIKPRKSYTNTSINFDWLGNNFSHFIRGLFDADGCIRIKNNNSLEITIAGHESYINEINNIMVNKWSCYKPKNENINILNKLWSNTDKCDFYKYLYTNATIWLQRKRDIFDDYIINNFGKLPEFEMYDITIDSEDHVYFCNGVLTHNCAEELRLAANVFNEPTWINAFNTGQDVHKMTAIKIFGEDHYCKEARKKAKTANFGILYGSSAWGFHNQFPDMSIEECEDFIDKFKSALPSIESAQRSAVRFARKNGFVKTYFGRPRRVKYYLEHPDRSMRNFGERTCKNTVVQGCAGDALKLMIIRLWNELFSKYPDAKWVGTIHDEVNYIVPKYLLNEVVPIIMKCQTIKLPDWPVVLEPDLSIGDSFGSLIPFYITYNDDGTVKEFVPQMEEIKNDKANETNKEDAYSLLLENDDYDYMQ